MDYFLNEILPAICLLSPWIFMYAFIFSGGFALDENPTPNDVEIRGEKKETNT